jgi:hypothetical protein
MTWAQTHASRVIKEQTLAVSCIPRYDPRGPDILGSCRIDQCSVEDCSSSHVKRRQRKGDTVVIFFDEDHSCYEYSSSRPLFHVAVCDEFGDIVVAVEFEFVSVGS